METWVIFIILYGLLKGSREPIKKNILKNVNVLTSLFVYTFIGFLMAVPTATGIFDVPPHIFAWIVVKSASIFFAWILSFTVLKKLPISTYGVTDMSRVIFSTLMGVVFLHESLTVKGVISLILVVSGLYIANHKTTENKEGYRLSHIWLLFLSCFLNGISGTLDKYIMSSGTITGSALQFWFMLILSLMYLAYILFKKEKLELKKALTNPWIYVLSFSLVFGDRLLFMANSDPASKVTIMTLIKQSSAIATIVLGKVLYHEKHIVKKLLCALIIIAGIALAIL
ncbi:MAG: EamA family transporter [Oscillospiraceae bacterium]|nr:EamA family transporter [Oscillospiraceae bacterium]